MQLELGGREADKMLRVVATIVVARRRKADGAASKGICMLGPKQKQAGKRTERGCKVEWLELTHRLVALVKTVGALHCPALSQHEKSCVSSADC